MTHDESLKGLLAHVETILREALEAGGSWESVVELGMELDGDTARFKPTGQVSIRIKVRGWKQGKR